METGPGLTPPPASLKSHLLSLHLCGEGVWGPHGFREHLPGGRVGKEWGQWGVGSLEPVGEQPGGRGLAGVTGWGW